MATKEISYAYATSDLAEQFQPGEGVGCYLAEMRYGSKVHRIGPFDLATDARRCAEMMWPDVEWNEMFLNSTLAELCLLR